LYEYASPKAEPQKVVVAHINPYLIEYGNVIVTPRMKPLCEVPPMANGSIPADGGNLILTQQEHDTMIQCEPESKQWIRPYLGADGVINGIVRHCLWLVDCPPHTLKKMLAIFERVEQVRAFRMASTKERTRKKANTPTLFTEDRQPERGYYLAVPRTSSENRRYIPIAILQSEIVAANDIQLVENATVFELGIITSAIHMAWMSTLTGRLESRFRYSNKIVYNNFPWPQTPSEAQKAAVDKAAQAVLDARAIHGDRVRPGRSCRRPRRQHRGCHDFTARGEAVREGANCDSRGGCAPENQFHAG